MRFLKTFGVPFALLLAGACAEPAPDFALTDAWVGEWPGPEGTRLTIAGGNGSYQVTVRNLDGPLTFAGSSTGDAIAFERAGVRETIRATDGAGTGMKWLADKKDCLVIRQSEGFCRDTLVQPEGR